MNLCRYKNIFGEPGTGIHKYRVMNIAILDVIVTLLIAFILSKLFRHTFLFSLAYLILLMIIIHRVFCVRTTTDKFLFPDKK